MAVRIWCLTNPFFVCYFKDRTMAKYPQIKKLPEYPKIVELFNKNYKDFTKLGLWFEIAEFMGWDKKKSWYKLFYWTWYDKMLEDKIKEEVEANPPSDEEIERKSQIARGMGVELFLRELRMVQANPKRLKDKMITKLTRLYSVIRSDRDSIEKLKIARGKLKLEAVRTLLPYHQMKDMPIDEIISLREKVNESFKRVLQLREGARDRQPPTNIG